MKNQRKKGVVGKKSTMGKKVKNQGKKIKEKEILRSTLPFALTVNLATPFYYL